MEREYGRLVCVSDPEEQGDWEAPNDLFEVRIPELVGRALDEAGQEISRYERHSGG